MPAGTGDRVNSAARRRRAGVGNGAGAAAPDAGRRGRRQRGQVAVDHARPRQRRRRPDRERAAAGRDVDHVLLPRTGREPRGEHRDLPARVPGTWPTDHRAVAADRAERAVARAVDRDVRGKPPRGHPDRPSPSTCAGNPATSARRGVVEPHRDPRTRLGGAAARQCDVDGRRRGRSRACRRWRRRGTPRPRRRPRTAPGRRRVTGQERRPHARPPEHRLLGGVRGPDGHPALLHGPLPRDGHRPRRRRLLDRVAQHPEHRRRDLGVDRVARPGVAVVEVGVAQQHPQQVLRADLGPIRPHRAPRGGEQVGDHHRVGREHPVHGLTGLGRPERRGERGRAREVGREHRVLDPAPEPVAVQAQASVSGSTGGLLREVGGAALPDQPHRAVLRPEHRDRADDAALRPELRRGSGTAAGRCAGRRRRASSAAPRRDPGQRPAAPPTPRAPPARRRPGPRRGRPARRGRAARGRPGAGRRWWLPGRRRARPRRPQPGRPSRSARWRAPPPRRVRRPRGGRR